MLFFTKYANIYLTQSFLKTPENKFSAPLKVYKTMKIVRFQKKNITLFTFKKIYFSVSSSSLRI